MNYIIPIMLVLIVGGAMLKNRPVYRDFIDGAGEGLHLLASIFPPLAAILTATAMLRASGALDIALGAIAPLTERVGIPSGAMPLVLIRPISGSGAMGVLSDILTRYGADSLTGRLASVICGSTETTFYCLAVYFSKTSVKNIARAVPCALIGDLAGVAAAAFALRVLGL